MKTIWECIQTKKKKKIATIQQQAAKIKLDRCDISSDVHYRLYKVSKKFSANISYINIDVNLHKFFIPDENQINKNFNNYVFAEYYENDEPAIIECFEKIKEDIVAKKSIFICLDLIGYGYDKEDDYSTHSVSCMLIPYKNNYRLIYINSHGNDVTKEFDIIIAKTKRPRIKKLKYKKSIDIVFMEKFVYNLNKELETFNETKHIKVEYTGTKIDTYSGANLQCNDNYGICYAFPYILYLYFGYYYNKARSIDNLIIESSYNLLRKGQVTKFVHACIAEFNEKFKKKVIEIENSENKKYNESFENIVYKEGTRFIKDITIPLISFMNQDCLKYNKGVIV